MYRYSPGSTSVFPDKGYPETAIRSSTPAPHHGLHVLIGSLPVAHAHAHGPRHVKMHPRGDSMDWNNRPLRVFLNRQGQKLTVMPTTACTTRLDFIVSDKTSEDNWYDGAGGERIAVRVSSADTNGMYAIVDSVAAPACSVPLHIHRNEEEHFLVLAGAYRVQIEDRIFDAPVGTSVTVPKEARHSWRNVSDKPSRLLVTLTPGGFEKCIQTIRDSPAEKVLEIAAQYGCFIVGPPVGK